MSHIAPQVNNARLTIPLHDCKLEEDQGQIAFINSKGFGGNNATGVVYSPKLTHQWLRKRYGEAVFADYQQRNRQVRRQANAYDQAASQGELNVIYLFGQQGINEEDVKIDMNGITIPGFEKTITYATDKEYPDF